MPYPKPPVEFVGAHPTNFTGGRNRAISRITFHYIVGDAGGARARFNTPNEQVSATYIIGSNGAIFNSVAEEHCAWADGNSESNNMTISIEHAGGHPSVPYTAQMYAASAQLVAYLIDKYKINDFKRHRDVSRSPTACPGELDCERIINEARRLIASNNPPPAPQPAPKPTPTIRYEKYATVRKVAYNKSTSIWNLGFTTWANATQVKPVEKGGVLDVAGVAYHPLGGKYYMSPTWFGDADKTGKPTYNIGVNVVDADPYVAPPPPPAPKPSEPVIIPNPTTPTVPPAPTPSVPVDVPKPTTPVAEPPLLSQEDADISLWQRIIEFAKRMIGYITRSKK